MNREVNLVLNIREVCHKIKPCLARRANEEQKRTQRYNDKDVRKEAIP